LRLTPTTLPPRSVAFKAIYSKAKTTTATCKGSGNEGTPTTKEAACKEGGREQRHGRHSHRAMTGSGSHGSVMYSGTTSSCGLYYSHCGNERTDDALFFSRACCPIQVPVVGGKARGVADRTRARAVDVLVPSTRAYV
jgi:hypothetical protein